MKQEPTILYPWQPSKQNTHYKTGYRSESCYDEWPCSFPGCTVMLNDIAVKNRKRSLCTMHEALTKRQRDKERWLRWKSRQPPSVRTPEKAFSIFMNNIARGKRIKRKAAAT